MYFFLLEPVDDIRVNTYFYYTCGHLDFMLFFLSYSGKHTANIYYYFFFLEPVEDIRVNTYFYLLSSWNSNYHTL